jgi:hypothetical protein
MSVSVMPWESALRHQERCKVAKKKERTYTVVPALPLTEKSRQYVRERVEARVAHFRNKKTEPRGLFQLLTIRSLEDFYNVAILYWKERGDMENSNRAAYALYYLRNVVRFRDW